MEQPDPTREAEARAVIDASGIAFLGDEGQGMLMDPAISWPLPPGSDIGDCMKQQRQELAALCAFIEEHGVRSVLEIGCWTGQLSRFLRAHTCVESTYAADLCDLQRERGLHIGLPPSSWLFVGDSTTDEFEEWRAACGHVDLVFIDGDHTEAGVRADWSIAQRHPCSFVGFHDIDPYFEFDRGVGRVFESIDRPRLSLSRPFDEKGLDRSVMGIGIVSMSS